MNKRKILWHGTHVEAMKLDLHEYMDALSFTIEHQLSKEALVMDLLIIKKDPHAAIKKNIGSIFKTYNVVEYKPERDSLTVNDYTKVLAYALLYSSFENVPLEEITVTFSLTVRPRDLFKYLKNVRGLDLISAGDGITYVQGDILPVQILESKRLPEDQNLFLRGLRRGNDAGKMSKILKEYDNLVGLDARNMYIDRLIQANEDAYREAIGMSEGLKRIMLEVAEETGYLEEKTSAAVAEATIKTARETAIETAKRLLDFNIPVEQIASATKLPIEEVKDLVKTSVSVR